MDASSRGVPAPLLIEPCTGSPVACFGAITVVVLCGAFIRVLFGKETTCQLEHVTVPGLVFAPGE